MPVVFWVSVFIARYFRSQSERDVADGKMGWSRMGIDDGLFTIADSKYHRFHCFSRKKTDTEAALVYPKYYLSHFGHQLLDHQLSLIIRLSITITISYIARNQQVIFQYER